MTRIKLKGCKLSLRKQEFLYFAFMLGATGRATARQLEMNYNTVCLFFRKCRQLQAEAVRREQAELVRAEQPTPEAETRKEAVQVDESYFGGNQPGKRGRGAAGKKIVAGAWRAGKAFAQVVKDVSGKTLRGFVEKVARPGEKVTTDGWKGYRGLGKAGFDHASVAHAKGEWKRGDGHTNGIENFWRQAKRRMFDANGQYLRAFPLYLGEAVWFYNHRDNPNRAMRRLIRESREPGNALPRRFRNGFVSTGP